jgi:pimeloyl-ACP methyl ester carboxylesterase
MAPPVDVVLIRGLVREAEHWGEFIEALRAALPSVRPHVVDLPGNGRRHREPSPLTVSAMVDAARADLAPRLPSGARPILVAVSLGGMVAMEWARRHGDELAGVVLANSSLARLSPPWQRIRAAVWPSVFRAAATRDVGQRERRILGLVSNRAEVHDVEGARWEAIARERPVSGQNALRQIVAAARFRGPAGPLPVPALVLVGDGDRLVSPACSRALAAHLGVELRAHPTAGHDLSLDAGPWFAAEVAAFAARLGLTGASAAESCLA